MSSEAEKRWNCQGRRVATQSSSVGRQCLDYALLVDRQCLDYVLTIQESKKEMTNSRSHQGNDKRNLIFDVPTRPPLKGPSHPPHFYLINERRRYIYISRKRLEKMLGEGEKELSTLSVDAEVSLQQTSCCCSKSD